MLTHEQLIERTESYLKSLIAEAADGNRDVDVAAPFGELGIDSFRVLKIIKALEADFGTLPKTLLFEHFNIESLARYFADKHAQTVAAKLAGADAAPAAAAPRAPAPVAVATAVAPPREPEPARLLEAHLPQHPQLDARVSELFAAHKNEGCVSRGTRNIAPNLFVGSAQAGYFNYARSGNTVLVYAYTGPEAYFDEIAGEMSAYCAGRGFHLNLFIDRPLDRVAGAAFTATPFGALQRVHGLQQFSLEGSAMKRLRYQLAKFEKSGECRTVEYACGSDGATDREIAAVIDRWCDGKTMVNPLIHLVRDEILAGRLHPQHRLFLTYLDGVLQNAILISRMCDALNGYLMDLEFYPREMPLGGLEYAIVNIMRALREEGCDLLSLGGTYGCRLEASDNADPAVDRILDDLHRQGIFNDEGNLQFKNKFRPENRTIFLCRPADGGANDNVLDLIMMIADPARAQTSEQDNHTHLGDGTVAATAAAAPAPTAAPVAAASVAADSAAVCIDGLPRSAALARSGFNPLNLPAGDVEFDLKTDSWAQLETDYVQRQMSQLRAQWPQAADPVAQLADIFGFEHCLLTESGRAAEALLCKAWSRRGVVLQNLLFPSGIFHQIDQGFVPREIPHPQALQPQSDEPYKANLDMQALRAQLDANAGEIAFVCIETCDNASGGHALSLAHLREVKALLRERGVALVIDATRVLENAQYLIEHEAEHAGQDLWSVARQILDCADAVTAALAKDFGVDTGGVVAVRDAALFARLRELSAQDGGGLDALEKRMVALALSQRAQTQARVRRRMQAARQVWSALRGQGVAVVAPAGAHCVLIEVKRLPEFAGFAHPVASFLAWLYLQTGVRAGAHSVGMQKGTAINDLVRLAIPHGLSQAQVDELCSRLRGAFAEPSNIPEIAPLDERPGDLHGHYALLRYHRSSAGLVAAEARPTPVAASPVSAATVANAALEPMRADCGDLAIVGMAGRYPKADSLAQFWDNLRQGRDCIGDLPAERLARRARGAGLREYRGGFIDAVDKFDSLFFNISPREAEMLDPQERLFLEVAWEAIEDAGYYPEVLGGDDGRREVGVFVGAVWAMYQILGVEEKLAGHGVNPNSFLWSVANRVSYWMNLRGPSLTVDTACSSSLTALHLACEAIRNGDCRSAIVGGVNLDLHQHKFDINWAGGALSPDGLCRTFGAGANGYVAGEGIGAIFIKPLRDALRDRDQVYGVIKGVSVNHGGRTSGYTVPNPKAQGELVAAALARAGVEPASIGYIEAHGTGTELGDPVEIAGLDYAFGADAVARQACPIGSVKTNIGHLEAAAGLVGVSKVLLQMKHRELVPSLHSAALNPLIDFAGSAFYVQQELQTWQPQRIGERTLPLRAGVSSFGAGGANAHVVLEQHVVEADEPAQAGDAGPLLFPLSARTPEQLREMAARLHAHLQRDTAAPRLSDIAFTLQNGRKSFEHRLVVLAASAERLRSGLAAFLAATADADVLTGNAKNAEGITKLLSQKEKEQFVELLRGSRDPHKLAQLWLDGLLSDCRGFGQGGRRVSLPTYPFADKRHWLAGGDAAAPLRAGARLHPLLDSNESTFQRQLFKKTFRADEFVLRDHVVSGIATLPGTAYLDPARKAGEIAAGRRVRCIRNVTWASPLTVDGAGATEAWVELKPSGDSALFEVFGEDGNGAKRLYAQGRLVYADSSETAAAADEYIDLAAIRARCAPVARADQAYPLFASVGMQYGPSFQVLREVAKNDEEVLGLLELPAVRGGDFDQFQLHPCLLDAAMQAGIAAQLGGGPGEMKVPYSLGEVELLHPLTRVCYSYVTRQPGARAGGVSRDDVAIVDESGKVLARIRETVGVPIASVHEKPAAPAVAQDGFEMLHYVPAWNAAPLAPAAAPIADWVLFDRDARLRDACLRRGVRTALVLPGDGFQDRGDGVYAIDPGNPDDYPRLFAALAGSGLALERICYGWGDGEVDAEAPDHGSAALAQALERGVYGLLGVCQALIERKPAAAQLVYLYSGAADGQQPHNEAVDAFARTLQLENPRFACKALALGAQAREPEALLELLQAEFADAEPAAAVRYRDGERQVRGLASVAADAPQSDSELALKHNGVYLITGGAGGLGLMFAEHLARRCQARLVLTGRSAPTPQMDERFEALRALGAQVLYVAADVSNAEDAQRTIAQARAEFGRIDGIVHAAGVLRDSLLRKKTRAEMQAVFAPKLFGSLHLDALTRDQDLDFFVLFSSLAAVGGNAGQCDYAFANRYMDAFAARRERLRAGGQRRGRTLSLNWSLWAEGGMKLDEPTEAFFRKTLGIRPLATELGLQAFANALRSDHAQVAVLDGVRAKIELAWGLTKKAPAAVVEAAPAAAPASAGGLQAAVTGRLTDIVTDLLKLPAEDLALDSVLLDLGFDSIGLATFANVINEAYGLDINPVLFFEYPSINAIAGALVAEHAQAVGQVHAVGGAAAAAAPQAAKAAPAVVAAEPTNGIDKSGGERRAAVAPSAANASIAFSRDRRFIDEPIAIVGIAGVMPQSRDLNEFWQNLRDQRDLVSEIPRDRWRWEDVHGDPTKDKNKSYSKWGGFIRDVDCFDPLFFGITPREAEMMDPQQRIFIQTVWAAIEDAGHKVSDLSGTRTGLFVGVSAKDYIDVLAENASALDGYSASGNSHSILANRVSFLFNLRGPSAPLDTACSSSLIALHRAIESIHTGSSDMAIVGGVQVMLTPVAHISLSSAGMLSPDGKCKTFDKDANGYVRGEGAGAILIKRLSQAQADGNPIYAVIRSTAENHGGRVTNLTAPNPKAQAELLVEAYQKADVDPATVGYIECHGTGTSLGDPIEIQALKKSFADLYRQHGHAAPTQPHCGLSAVKTNIGHLEPAAGIASLLKVLLAMKHRQIPALLHFDQLNPYIDLSASPFYIVDKTAPWEAPRAADGSALPRRAGVSSFGWGGANAHVVVEEYQPPSRPAAAPHGPQLVLLSAKRGERLQAYAADWLEHLRSHPCELADLAYTSQVGRDAMDERLALVAGSFEEVLAQLQAFVEGSTEVVGLHRGRIARRREDLLAAAVDADTATPAQLAQAWILGHEIDWARLHAGAERRRLSLPSYPFAQERYWIEIAPAREETRASASVTELHAPEVGSVLAQPVWEAAAQTAGAGEAWQQHEVILCGLERFDIERLRSALPDGAQVARMALPHGDDPAQRYRAAALACFERLQAWMQRKPQAPVLVQIVADGEGGDALMAGLSGLLRSARLENPRVLGQLVQLDADGDESLLAQRLIACGALRNEAHVVYAQGRAQVQRWREAPAGEVAPVAFRDRGVYLVTGGLGGLGQVFARDILRQSPTARVVLSGRGELDERQRAGLTQLAADLSVGSEQLIYRRLDLADATAVETLVAELIERHGALNGVLHSAGMTRDSLIVNKTAADFAQVLEPKVLGTAHLDRATAGVDLDFFVLFSSVSGALGNAGQADYAAANAFMDRFAHYRNAQVDAGARRGRTLSLNWPLWEEGGMQLDANARAWLLKTSGMLPMRTASGVQALHRALDLQAGQVLVMEGQVERLRRFLVPGPGQTGTTAASKPAAAHAERLKQLILADLRGFQAKGN